MTRAASPSRAERRKREAQRALISRLAPPGATATSAKAPQDAMTSAAHKAARWSVAWTTQTSPCSVTQSDG